MSQEQTSPAEGGYDWYDWVDMIEAIKANVPEYQKDAAYYDFDNHSIKGYATPVTVPL